MNIRCEKHTELLADADSVLKKIHDLTVRQREVVEIDGVSVRFLLFDKQLELLMGEKERAVGALREHDIEHGCQTIEAHSPNSGTIHGTFFRPS